MTASLPPEVQSVFDRFITTEYTTVDAKSQPITWPVTPYYSPGAESIDVTTGIGYPKKAYDAKANHHVALLFSEPKGSGIDDAPMVLVQGCAKVDDADLDANADRYAREMPVKLPSAPSLPPGPLRRTLGWYFKRLYVDVRPERVFVWHGGDPTAEPELFGDHMEEVRSGHFEEPEEAHADPDGGRTVWDERIDELGATYDTAVLSFVAPDGFPFSVRAPVRVDRGAKRINIAAEIPAAPLEPGLACVTAHDHHPEFKWQRNFQVRGDLRRADDGTWFLEPHKLIGGFELPPSSGIQRTKDFIGYTRKYRRIAKRELAKRT